MGGAREIAGDRLVTMPAGIASNVGSPGDCGRRHDGWRNCSTGNQKDSGENGGGVEEGFLAGGRHKTT